MVKATRRAVFGSLITAGLVGQAAVASAEEPTADGLVQAGDLLGGDLLLDRDGLLLVVEGVTRRGKSVKIAVRRNDSQAWLRGPGADGIFPAAHGFLVLRRRVPTTALAPATDPAAPTSSPAGTPPASSGLVLDGGRP